MFGGVAQRYILWKMVGEPYKKGKNWYVKMEHPVTKIPTEVRWYTDKAHADLMPRPKDAPFAGRGFGFSDKDDYILAIRQRDLTKKEEDDYFHYNWKRGGKWVFGGFMGGIWYARKDAEIPPIGRVDRVFRISWPEMVKAGQANSMALNDGKKEGFWFEQ